MGIFEPFFYIIGLVTDIYFKLVVVQIVLYWLIHFKVLKIENKYAEKTMNFLNAITEPVYKKIREKVPTFNGIDFSPFILMLVLLFVARLMFRICELLV